MKKIKRKHMKNNNKGISLIVLIITIIVVIILAAVVILNLSNNNPVSSAKEATFKSDIRSFQEELSMYIANETMIDYSGNREKLTMTEVPTLDDMKGYIENYAKKYDGKLGIEEDELVYYPKIVTDIEKKWLDELGIKPSGYMIEVADNDFFEWDGFKITGIKEAKKEEFQKFIEDNKGVLKIPEECTAIGDKVFFNCDYLESVITDEKLNSIGKYSFTNCSLNKITLNDKVASLGYCAFQNSKLVEIKIPNSVSIMYDFCFQNCKNLKNVIIDADSILQSISRYAFDGCTALNNINISDKLVTINENAFSGCDNLSYILIPKGVESISSTALYACNILENIDVSNDNKNYSSQDGVLFNKDKTTINRYPQGKKDTEYSLPKTVTKIYDNAFVRASNLQKIIISNDVNYIGISAFRLCNNLKEVDLPNNLKELYQFSFSGCANLTSIVIPDNVTQLCRETFQECSNLEEVTIPNSITYIEKSVFPLCPKLENIIFNGTKEQWNNISKNSYWNNSSSIKTITCTDGIINL